MKKNVVKLNETQLRKVVRESVKKVLKESYANEHLLSLFMDWAFKNPQKCPIDVDKAMHEYYYDGNEDNLYRAAEMFAQITGFDMNEIFKTAKTAATRYYYFTPDKKRLSESARKVLKEGFNEDGVHNTVDNALNTMLNSLREQYGATFIKPALRALKQIVDRYNNEIDIEEEDAFGYRERNPYA